MRVGGDGHGWGHPKRGLGSKPPLTLCPWCHWRHNQTQSPPVAPCWVMWPQTPSQAATHPLLPTQGLGSLHGLNGPQGPSSSFHHWRSLPHHKLRPACRKHHQGRRGEGDHPAGQNFGGGGLKRGSARSISPFLPPCSPPATPHHLTGGLWGCPPQLYSLHGLEEGLPVIWERHDELELGPAGLLD